MTRPISGGYRWQRVALYARPTPDRAGVDARLAGLAAQVARRRCWVQVATYRDTGPDGPALAWLLSQAGWAFDLVVVEDLGQLAVRRGDRAVLVSRLAAAGVSVVAVDSGRSCGRRLARLAADLVLADLIGQAATR